MILKKTMRNNCLYNGAEGQARNKFPAWYRKPTQVGWVWRNGRERHRRGEGMADSDRLIEKYRKIEAVIQALRQVGAFLGARLRLEDGGWRSSGDEWR